jgi:glycosyltransferase involved in cell wall biosynthesis
MNPPHHILHIISGLHVGGAEMALHRLLSTMDRGMFQSSVISLTDDQPVGEMIRKIGVPVTALGFKPGTLNPLLAIRLRKQVIRCRPDLIQTWMYHSDLLGGLVARAAGSPPVVWGIRHTVTDSKSLKPATYLVANISAFFSHYLPQKIVCNAEAGRDTHIALGYDRAKMVVIGNGFDVSNFHPNPAARDDLRQELGIERNTILIGMGARFNPQKDHANFMQAASILKQDHNNIHFILWGKDVDQQNQTLQTLIRSLNIEPCIHLLGLRVDAPSLFAALDVATLSSAYGEAFPQVVGEAMACGIPCVVTNVGDSATLVDDTGRVVPPRDYVALANAWAELLDLPESERLLLSSRARQRIIDCYSLKRMAESYSQLYRDIIADINFQ